MRGALLLLCLLALACCWQQGEACRTSAECGGDECCVSNMRPIGKRQLSATTGGRCHPRGKLNGGCLLRDAVYDRTRIYFECPCVDGLTCKGNGMIDIPLGETGTCVHA